MRIFVALDIEDAIRARVQRFLEGVREFAPGARWVKTESLHVTLKFVGEKPAEMIEAFRQTLAAVRSDILDLTFRGYGFFPTPKSARVFWIGIESGMVLPALAKKIDDASAALGVARETHAFSPHLTLARGGGGSGAPGRNKADQPNQNFRKLQEKLAALPTPEFGTMSAREFFLYESKLSPGGPHYTKIASFSLGDAEK